MSAQRDFVRDSDPDRYICALFAEPKFQQDLFSLYAFYIEISDIPHRVKEPQLGQIRLQWWRDVIENISDTCLHYNFISRGLCQVYERYNLSSSCLNVILDTRLLDLEKYQPETISDLISYLKGTSGAVSLLALDIIGIKEPETRTAVEEVAIAYGLIGIIRSTSFLAARDRILLPKELLQTHKILPDDIIRGSASCHLKIASQQVIDIGRAFLKRARARRIQGKRGAMCCLLLATLTNLYMARLVRFRFDAFKPEINELTPFKPWILTFNSLLGRF